ncbi:hypothetical protein CHARACLAT_023282 [Characodon lateralis]|uniref:Uncharacterized protein n=1 Tax=Characodon lateralis TaxID=208331 RepID=A0ABU7DWP2_9TELE|nr:hypothetical protein [Characodon lateralis]
MRTSRTSRDCSGHSRLNHKNIKLTKPENSSKSTSTSRIKKISADRRRSKCEKGNRNISLASVFWTSTLLLPPDYRSLPSHWGCKPKNLCDVFLPSAVHHTEEPKFTFLILPRSLKRSLDFNYNVIQHHKQNSQLCILHLVLRTNGGIQASGSGFACLAFGFLLLPFAGLEV